MPLGEEPPHVDVAFLVSPQFSNQAGTATRDRPGLRRYSQAMIAGVRGRELDVGRSRPRRSAPLVLVLVLVALALVVVTPALVRPREAVAAIGPRDDSPPTDAQIFDHIRTSGEGCPQSFLPRRSFGLPRPSRWPPRRRRPRSGGKKITHRPAIAASCASSRPNSSRPGVFAHHPFRRHGSSCRPRRHPRPRRRTSSQVLLHSSSSSSSIVQVVVGPALAVASSGRRTQPYHKDRSVSPHSCSVTGVRTTPIAIAVVRDFSCALAVRAGNCSSRRRTAAVALAGHAQHHHKEPVTYSCSVTGVRTPHKPMPSPLTNFSCALAVPDGVAALVALAFPQTGLAAQSQGSRSVSLGHSCSVTSFRSRT